MNTVSCLLKHFTVVKNYDARCDRTSGVADYDASSVNYYDDKVL